MGGDLIWVLWLMPPPPPGATRRVTPGSLPTADLRPNLAQQALSLHLRPGVGCPSPPFSTDARPCPSPRPPEKSQRSVGLKRAEAIMQWTGG